MQNKFKYRTLPHLCRRCSLYAWCSAILPPAASAFRSWSCSKFRCCWSWGTSFAWQTLLLPFSLLYVSTECARTTTLLRLLELERDKARKTLTFIRSRRRRGDHTQACLRSGAHFREGLKGSSTKGVEQSCCPLRKASNYGKGEDAELTRITPKKKTVEHFAISDHAQNHQ